MLFVEALLNWMKGCRTRLLLARERSKRFALPAVGINMNQGYMIDRDYCTSPVHYPAVLSEFGNQLLCVCYHHSSSLPGPSLWFSLSSLSSLFFWLWLWLWSVLVKVVVLKVLFGERYPASSEILWGTLVFVQ